MNGTLRGEAFYPLLPTVPEAAGRNPVLYELLVLFDAVHGGSPRERALVEEYGFASTFYIELEDEGVG